MTDQCASGSRRALSGKHLWPGGEDRGCDRGWGTLCGAMAKGFAWAGANVAALGTRTGFAGRDVPPDRGGRRRPGAGGHGRG